MTTILDADTNDIADLKPPTETKLALLVNTVQSINPGIGMPRQPTASFSTSHGSARDEVGPVLAETPMSAVPNLAQQFAHRETKQQKHASRFRFIASPTSLETPDLEVGRPLARAPDALVDSALRGP